MKRPPDSCPAPFHPGSVAASVAALLALGGHLTLTLVYLSPPNIAQEHLGALAQRYMRPLFAQNWHLFSPNPGVSSRKLAIRCQAGDTDWSEWFDPLEGLVAEHYHRRISGLGKLLYVYRAVGEDLRGEVMQRMLACHRRRLAAGEPAQAGAVEADSADELSLGRLGAEVPACSPESMMDDLTQTREFELATRYALRVCEEYVDEDWPEIERIQFKLLEFFPVKYADRAAADASGRRWGEVHELFFPILEGE